MVVMTLVDSAKVVVASRAMRERKNLMDVFMMKNTLFLRIS